jgi:hypothetical protein
VPTPDAPPVSTARGRDPDGRPNGVTYRRQYVRCGRAGCRRCPPQGPGHGPYWYGFYWDYRQRTRSFYVGKRLPPGAEVLAGAADSPPDPESGPAAPEGGDALTPNTP